MLSPVAGVCAAFSPHPKSFTADCLLPWIAEGMGAEKAIYELAVMLPRSLGSFKGMEGAPAPLATMECLKPDPDTQIGCLGLQPETCRRQEHTSQMYLCMSSEKVSQIYYFPLASPSQELLPEGAIYPSSSVQAMCCLPRCPDKGRSSTSYK